MSDTAPSSGSIPGALTVALDLTGAGGVRWTARGRPAQLAGDLAYYQRIANLLAAPPGSMLGAPPDLGGDLVAEVGEALTRERQATIAARAAALIAADPDTLTAVNVVVWQSAPSSLDVAADITTTTGLATTLRWTIS